VTLAERLLIGFAIACALAYAVTPYAIALANRLEFFDKPVGYKGHLDPTPYLGGAAVMVGFVVAVALAAGDWKRTAPLLGGALVMWAVGTVDDRRTVSPAVRVLVELALAVAVWAADLGWHLHAGPVLDLALTCAWVIGVVNAFNLFDNMDGAASMMALVVSAGAALIGVVQGDVWLAVGAASLCGASLGFLPRNLAVPSRIFLGDGGSMPLGFAVAVLVTAAAGTSAVAWRSLLVALLLVGIPVLDTTLVIVSRRRRGVSVLTGGRDHLTHRARKLLASARSVALLLGLIQAGLSVVAVLASRGEAALVVISASIYLLTAGVAIVLLDTQKLEEFAVARGGADRIALWSSKRALTCLVVLGLGAGLSPFFFAYYDPTVWTPIGFGLTLLCAVGLVMSPFRPSAPGALCLGGLFGLGLWSLASAGWAESIESAVVTGNRWLVYGALLLVILVLVSHDRRAAVLMGALGVGVGVVAVSVLGRMLGGDPGALFLGGRLNSPLGYINGEGSLFAMGIWPCVALAESRRVPIAGAGVAAATALASLALLSQSRGTALSIAGAVVAAVVLVPGGTRRIYALLVVAGGVALASGDLLHVYQSAGGGEVSRAAAHAAGRATVLAALAGGATWAILRAGWAAAASPRLASVGRWLLVAGAVAALAVGAGAHGHIERVARKQWNAFVHLAEPSERQAPSTNRSRLLSGAGNRYDYWRVAWEEWRAHPLAGVGAGNFPRTYYERRATSEDVDQPHSIELQALAELGVVGLLLLCLLPVGVFWGALRARARGRVSPLRRALSVSGVGLFATWLVQTSVDWMHLLPGVTAIGLAGAAMLVWPRGTPATLTAPPEGAAPGASDRGGRLVRHRSTAALGLAGVMAALIVMGASLSRQGLAQVFAARARSELSANPGAALTDANRSLSMDADATRTYYVKAAALSRFDRAAGAEGALAKALAREPDNFVTWALLADIELRQRRVALAARYYGRAHALNPRDATLAVLARDPAAGLR
jgi:UDP-GlcNAc:undecaprenyl-phosphate GlcNAc-1-phosphate transferase